MHVFLRLVSEGGALGPSARCEDETLSGIGAVDVQKLSARATLCGDRRGRCAKTEGFLRLLPRARLQGVWQSGQRSMTFKQHSKHFPFLSIPFLARSANQQGQPRPKSSLAAISRFSTFGSGDFHSHLTEVCAHVFPSLLSMFLAPLSTSAVSLSLSLS